MSGSVRRRWLPALELLGLRVRHTWPFRISRFIHGRLPWLVELSWVLRWRPRRRALSRKAPFKHLTAETLELTCIACPAQWEGELDDGRELYVRYRSGWFSVSIDGTRVLSERIGDCFHGYMETDEMLMLTGLKG